MSDSKQKEYYLKIIAEELMKIRIELQYDRLEEQDYQQPEQTTPTKPDIAEQLNSMFKGD